MEKVSPSMLGLLANGTRTGRTGSSCPGPNWALLGDVSALLVSHSPCMEYALSTEVLVKDEAGASESSDVSWGRQNHPRQHDCLSLETGV